MIPMTEEEKRRREETLAKLKDLAVNTSDETIMLLANAILLNAESIKRIEPIITEFKWKPPK